MRMLYLPCSPLLAKAVLFVGLIAALSGCQSEAQKQAEQKELWESSRVPPPGYVENAMKRQQAAAKQTQAPSASQSAPAQR